MNGPEIIKAPDLYIGDTGTDRGRGVFAARAFSKDEVVEVCPVLIIVCRFSELPPDLKTYVYYWGENAQAVALGFGSMYNHRDPPNLCYRHDYAIPALKMVALREIKQGEELRINYNGTEDSDWFDRMNVELIED